MTESETIAAEIARALHAAAVLPHEKRLWSVSRIAEYFDVSETTCYRAIICKPDFPAPIKIAGGPLRWVCGEVIEWAENQRRKVRRERKAA